MVNYAEWTEEHLKQLVRERVRESAGFEYKRCGSLRLAGNKTKQNIIDEVSKDISAMSNANGGVFIYGISEDNEEATGLEDGFGPQDFQPDWLENIILSSITPRVEQLLIHPIPLTSRGPGFFAYLVAVGRSSRGCQANDKRYYRRRNFRNDILDDWELRELLSRSAHPLVTLDLTTKVSKQRQEEHIYWLMAKVENTGFRRAHDVRVQLDVPKDFVHSDNIMASRRPPQSNGFVIREIGGSEAAHRSFDFRSTQPLFPQDSTSLLNDTLHNELKITVNTELYRKMNEAQPAIRWTLFADDMLPQRGAIPLRKITSF